MKVYARANTRFDDKEAKLIARFLETHFPDGNFQAKQIVDLARSKTSPIHRFFNWNDSEAAERYRILQAQSMVRCLVVEIDDREVRKYVSPVVVSHGKPKQYCEIERAMADEDIWNQVLARALQDANSWKLRYQNLKELEPIHTEIEKASKKYLKEGN